jgi:hypothetical protein
MILVLKEAFQGTLAGQLAAKKDNNSRIATKASSL